MTRDLFPFSNQFLLSNELLLLMQWIVDHQQEEFKDLIKQALKNGLKEKISLSKNSTPQTLSDSTPDSIIDFFNILEALYYESASELSSKHDRTPQLTNIVSKIDSSVCDDVTVEFSLEKANSKIENNPDQDAKEVLFQELLRCWKPHDKKLTH